MRHETTKAHLTLEHARNWPPMSMSISTSINKSSFTHAKVLIGRRAAGLVHDLMWGVAGFYFHHQNTYLCRYLRYHHITLIKARIVHAISDLSPPQWAEKPVQKMSHTGGFISLCIQVVDVPQGTKRIIMDLN